MRSLTLTAEEAVVLKLLLSLDLAAMGFERKEQNTLRKISKKLKDIEHG